MKALILTLALTASLPANAHSAPAGGGFHSGGFRGGFAGGVRRFGSLALLGGAVIGGGALYAPYACAWTAVPVYDSLGNVAAYTQQCL
jgi:hypothetical protein